MVDERMPFDHAWERVRMAYPIEKKLVVRISSTALFDFSTEHAVYLNEGHEAFRAYQIEHRADVPRPGAAYPFIKRLLHLNKIFPDYMPVEVVILSRNDPEAGLRMMDAMPTHGLDITRAFFLSGKAPYPYMAAVNACLYLSTDKIEVKDAIMAGYPARHVLPCSSFDDTDDTQLRIAFDFDGVLVDDEAETKYADGGLPLFHHHEVQNKDKPLKNGPLMPLMQRISGIQKIEAESANRVNSPEKAIRVSIVTARNAPAHERLINTMKHLGIEVDELFLTGGIEKKNILDVMKPQIFFDDQIGHLKPASENTPCVHIPFGIRNQ
jgi:5'-nucleotidase